MMDFIFELAIYSFSSGSFFQLVFVLLWGTYYLKETKKLICWSFVGWESIWNKSEDYFCLHIFSASVFVPITLDCLLVIDLGCHCCAT